MHNPPHDELASDIEAWVGRLTLEEKVSLVSGGSAWGTAALPSIGLREMVLSDGPSGVRGSLWDERSPSLCLPSATALSSSWDVELAREYGAVVAAEARRKDVDVVLGPTVNLHRSPLGGRHFEAFSEDPLLTGDLAAAYVDGVQAAGVGVAIKHYVANDFETDRFNADVRVSQRALRELYLLAFERAVRESRAWSVMSAYNSINGVTATENELLTTPLTAEWGFDGVVVSDWTAVRSVESARHPQDLAMPGPAEAWSDQLAAAVRSGVVAEDLIDRKVARILHLATRVGAITGHDPQPIVDQTDGPAFARRAGAEGMVLLRNDGILPLEVGGLTRVAVIGESARHPRVQGGGSATVIPEYAVSPLDGLRAALPDTVVVDYSIGARVHDDLAAFEPARLQNPISGGPGARVTYLDGDGHELYSEDRYAGYILEYGTDERDARRRSVTFTTVFTPENTGELELGFASPGHGRLYVDGALVLEGTLEEHIDQVQAFFFPPSLTAPVAVAEGVPMELHYEFTPGAIIDGVPGSVNVTFGSATPANTAADDQELIDRAVESARQADVAVVVVGTNAALESEGFDRADLRLPGAQDALVAAVTAVNPHTVVIVNAGAPVEMPWRSDAAAVLLAWFGGQEFGHALADVLTGAVEPGGRLPTTWPKTLADVPVSDVTPRDGVLAYDEGIQIGYRAWLTAGTEPAYPFGHGLGYTTWELGAASVVEEGDGFDVTLDVRNTGGRAGKQVVHVYARLRNSLVERPPLWLVGFAVIRAEVGQSAEARITVPRRSLAYWDDGWTVESGTYELLVGTSIAELSDPVPVTVREKA